MSAVSRIISKMASEFSAEQWGYLQKRFAEPGGLYKLISEMLDDMDPDGAADRKAARDARKAARDARREARDEVFEGEEEDGPKAMDRRRRVTAEDHALFASMYPNAKLPEFVGEDPPRRPAAPRTSAAVESFKKLYPDAQPVNHAPGNVTGVII